MNKLYYGDNLKILREHGDPESIDLIYLDPPFNSNRGYNILFKDESGEEAQAQIRAFEDTWHWNTNAAQTYHDLVTLGDVRISNMMNALRQFLGTNQMTAYLVMIAARLVELHRVLKPTGSLYLHCDPTASHYLKVVLDTIFGPENFRNEIIWRRTGAHGPRRSFGPIHDVILFYTKTPSYFFNIVKRPYMKGHVESRYAKDETGRYKFISGGNVLTGPGATSGESGAAWKGFNPTTKKRHWAIPGFLVRKMPSKLENMGVLSKLNALHKMGFIEIKEGAAWPTPVRYLDEDNGQPLQDIWAYQPYTKGTVHGTEEGIEQDVAWLGPTDPERLGYQTQKPLGLLERIIKSSCPPDGTVLDPFCGCGTTIATAQKLGRRWIGIDITHLAITLQKYRLKRDFKLKEKEDYVVECEPVDLASAQQLAQDDRYQFQWWVLSLVKARPLSSNDGDSKKGKKGKDKGIDGIITFIDDNSGKAKRVLVQVKSGKVKSGDIRDLRGTIEREKAAMGVFITLGKPSDDMHKEAADAEFYHSDGLGRNYPKLQILTVAGLLNGAEVKMPREVFALK